MTQIEWARTVAEHPEGHSRADVERACSVLAEQLAEVERAAREHLTEAETAEAARLAAEMRGRLIRDFGPHAPMIVGAVYEHLSRAVLAVGEAGASYADAVKVVAVCAREAAAVLESGAEVVARRGRS